MNEITYIDLFRGIGGFHLGLQQAGGFKCVWSNDINKYASEVYKVHWPTTPEVTGDIRDVKAEDIPDHDLLCAGFPCPSFSLAGKQLGFNDKRGALFFEIIRILREKQPKMLLLENVKGLLYNKTFIQYDGISDILYNEITSGTRWEKKYTPRSNWIIFEENITSYIADKLLNTLDLQNQELDISLITSLGLNLENTELLVEDGIKKRLKYLETQILQYTKNLNYSQIEHGEPLEQNVKELMRHLKTLYSTDSLKAMDICSLEKIMDMCVDAETSQRKPLEENLRQVRLSTTSTSINWMTVPKIFIYVKEVNILSFISQQIKLSTPLWRRAKSNLIKKKVNMYYVKTFNIIIDSLQKLGYDIEYQVLNSKHFGVPQGRQRVFIIGHLRGSGGRPIFPITGTRRQTAKPEAIRLVVPVITPNRLNKRQNGPRFRRPGDPAFTLTAQDRHGVMIDGRIRRLTPVECERLQGFPEIENLITLNIQDAVWCLENQRNHVSVEDLNHKSLKHAGAVESVEKKDSVLSAVKRLSIKDQQKNKPAPENVRISCVGGKVEIRNHGKLISSVNTAEKLRKYLQLTKTDDFAQLIAGLNTIQEKITRLGEVELPANELLSIVPSNGKPCVKLSGKEITQLVEDVKRDSTIHRKHLKSITSNRLNIESLDLSQITSFCYVMAIITGFIRQETQIKNLSKVEIYSILGWTAGVSDHQRYRALGNAVTVNVIKYLGEQIKKSLT